MAAAYELDITLEGERYIVGFDQESDIDYAGNDIFYPHIIYINDEDGEYIDIESFNDEELDFLSDACCLFICDCRDDNYNEYGDDNE